VKRYALIVTFRLLFGIVWTQSSNQQYWQKKYLDVYYNRRVSPTRCMHAIADFKRLFPRNGIYMHSGVVTGLSIF
jgi:hypothetical protein